MNATDANMNNKICLITGATAGIGLSTARILAQRGAQVILLGRDKERGQSAVANIKQATGRIVEFMSADLSDQAAIRDFAARYKSSYSRLDVLVNNAGGMFGRRQISVDGIEMTFALNHLSYFLLTNLLMPSLQAAPQARVVNVSSDAHFGIKLDLENLQSEGQYSGWLAYKRSKLCNLLFTYELSRRLKETDITSNALHPGFVNTQIGIRNSWTNRLIWKIFTQFAISPEHGAQTSAYLACSSDVASVTGSYFANCRIKPSSQESRDLLVAKRLWDISVLHTRFEEINLP